MHNVDAQKLFFAASKPFIPCLYSPAMNWFPVLLGCTKEAKAYTQLIIKSPTILLTGSRWMILAP